MGELSSDMQGTEEFADMGMEELGKSLPMQGDAPRGEAESGTRPDGGRAVNQGAREAQAAPGGTGAQGQEEKPADMSTPDLRTEIATLRNELQQAIRENRGYAALKSQLDKVQNELKARGAAPAAAPTLTPEQQSVADQQHAAEDYLKKFLGDNLDPLMRAKYGNIIEAIERQENDRSQAQFKGSVEQLCKEMNVPFESKNAEDFPLNPIFGKLIKADVEVYDTDPAAKARIDRIMGNWDPYELMMRAMRERSAAIQAQGARVQQQQQTAAKGGARTVKAGGAKPDDKQKYSAEDLGSMSEADRERAYDADPEAYEASIPRQGRR